MDFSLSTVGILVQRRIKSLLTFDQLAPFVMRGSIALFVKTTDAYEPVPLRVTRTVLDSET